MSNFWGAYQLTEVFTRTYYNEYDVLISVSARAYNTSTGTLALGGCAAPLGLNKCVSLINPGLAHWAMQECRPCRAHLRFWLF